jgi:hypothetical protein
MTPDEIKLYESDQAVRLHLISECDQAAELGFSRMRIAPIFCYWCESRSHFWKNCPEYEVFVRRIVRAEKLVARFWTVVTLLATGFVAGLCVRGL